MYTIRPTTRFQKDLKLAAKRGYRIDLLTEVIKKLAAGEDLDESYKDHPLNPHAGSSRPTPFPFLFIECDYRPNCLWVYRAHLVIIMEPMQGKAMSV